MCYHLIIMETHLNVHRKLLFKMFLQMNADKTSSSSLNPFTSRTADPRESTLAFVIHSHRFKFNAYVLKTIETVPWRTTNARTNGEEA